MSHLPPGLDRTQRPIDTAPETPLLRQPARSILAAGAAVVIVGCFLPWAVGRETAYSRLVSHRIFEGTIDGIYLLIAALLLFARALTRGVDRSESRTFQLAPLVVAGLAAVVWVSGEQAARGAVTAWERTGGEGRITDAPAITLVGILVAGAAAVWLEIRRPPEVRENTPSLVAEWEISRPKLVVFAAGVLGAVAGGLGAMLLGTAVLGWQGMVITLLLTLFAGLLAAQASMSLAHRVVSR
jgi:hypothetical protein